MNIDRSNQRLSVFAAVVAFAVLVPILYLFSYYPLLSLLSECYTARQTLQWAYAPVRRACDADPFFEPMQAWAAVWGVENRSINRNNMRQIALAIQEEAQKTTRARLEVNLRGTRDDPRLVVTLHNEGTIPLKYDHEMVFLLQIVPVSAEGVSVPPDEVRYVTPENRSPEAFRKRFVALAPGKSVSREIRLKRGFKNFVFALSDTGRVSSYEVVSRLPESKAVDRFFVRYEASADFDVAFSQYTGLDLSDLDLYEGPLRKTIRLAGLEASGDR